MSGRRDMVKAFNWPATPARPLVIGHRGACAHAPENTLASFRAASELGADMWELDVRLTADGVCVVSHDDDLSRSCGVPHKISEMTAVEVAGTDVPTFVSVVALAQELGAGLYVELKGEGTGQIVWRELMLRQFSFAVIGSFQVDWVRDLRDSGCDYPLSVLVRVGVDPFALADRGGADIIHLCWESASDNPQTLVTPALLDRARARGLEVVLWHEERKPVLAALVAMPVLGICSDQPELLYPYAPAPDLPIAVCCHRGANHFAPENTLAAARICFDQRVGYVELDVHTTSDGAAVVIHDPKVDRTTDGHGPVAGFTLSEIRALDAGSWFSRTYRGERIPTLEEMLDLAKASGQGLYIELKTVDPALVLRLVKAAGMFERCFFWSGDFALIRAVKQVDPGARVMVRRRDYATLDAMFADISPWLVEFDPRVDDLADMAECRGRGGLVMLQYFGADEAIFAKMIALKPDMMNVDRADVFLKAYARMQAGADPHAVDGVMERRA